MHRPAESTHRSRKNSKKTSRGNRWQLQDAKAQFSRVVRDAKKGPQIITVHGEEVAVIESIEDYRKRTGAGKKHPDWIAALLKCPPGPPLSISRDTSDTVGAGTPNVFE
jgi:prevent-host-death family protein